MNSAIAIKPISSGSFGPICIDMVDFWGGKKSSKLKTVTATPGIIIHVVPFSGGFVSSERVTQFWGGVYRGIGGRSRKSERDFVVDASMSVDDILRAIGR